jgi:hypothetical protein
MVAALKLILSGLKNMSSLKINYSKSDLISLNLSKTEKTQLARILCCKL